MTGYPRWREMCYYQSLRRHAREGNGTPLQYCCLKNPWTEEPGRLQSMGLQRVGQDLATEQQQQNSFFLKFVVSCVEKT